jgi:uncharacterized membrane protein
VALNIMKMIANTRTRLAVAVIASVVLSLALQRCSPTCDIEEVAEAVSPDKTRIATVFIENCHATAPFVTAVNLRCATCKFDGDDYVFAVEGKRQVSLTWNGNGSLTIQHDEQANVYRRNSAASGVSINYISQPVSQADRR